MTARAARTCPRPCLPEALSQSERHERAPSVSQGRLALPASGRSSVGAVAVSRRGVLFPSRYIAVAVLGGVWASSSVSSTVPLGSVSVAGVARSVRFRRSHLPALAPLLSRQPSRLAPGCAQVTTQQRTHQPKPTPHQSARSRPPAQAASRITSPTAPRPSNRGPCGDRPPTRPRLAPTAPPQKARARQSGRRGCSRQPTSRNRRCRRCH